jgi:hypothetical protein
MIGQTSFGALSGPGMIGQTSFGAGEWGDGVFGWGGR